MDLLWFLDAPFWQKLFWITMVAGVSSFVYIFINYMLPEVFKDIEDWKKVYKKNRSD